VRGIRYARIFWIGAAGILVLAALVAIAAIARGDFGDTDAQILGTLFASLLAGATAISGLALLERRTLVAFAWTCIGVATVTFVVIGVAIWSDGDAVDWEWAARAIVVLIGLLIVATQRLLLKVDAFRPLVVGTAAAAALATLLTCVGIGADNRDGLWQFTAICWIAAGLGFLLLPVLQRWRAAPPRVPGIDRVIAQLDGVELVATRSESGLELRLAPDERLLLRRRA
jgi:peptidoglycan/LPS O-acetylase OafA/YrhL